MEFQDPYNWKYPNRNDLMTLSTINQQDIGKVKYNPLQTRNACLVNNDIEGAQSFLKPYQYTNKETFQNRNDDIIGAQPKKVFRDPRPPQFIDNTLKIDDIKGAQPKAMAFSTNRSPINPLNPQYQLSKVVKREITPPKFIRDSINNQDIEGSQPKLISFKPRKDPYSYDEIEGVHPRKVYVPVEMRNSLDVKDINSTNEKKYLRTINPLNPVYKVQDENGKYYNIGQIDGSQNRRLHPIESKKQDYSLINKDIPGAWADTHAQQFLKVGERKEFRQINQTLDIVGAQGGTKKFGLQTKRQINPLQPQYNYPGASEDVFGNKIIDSRKNSQSQSVLSQSAFQNLAFNQKNTQNNGSSQQYIGSKFY